MDLTPVDRWMLVNQYRLLERLYPEDAEEHRRIREALESGDAKAITAHAAFLAAVEPPLGDEEAAFVDEILEMYQALQRCHGALEDASGIEAEHVRFPGFAAGTEEGFRRHTRALIAGDDALSDFDRTDDLESAADSLPRYRRMLDAWRLYGRSTDLSKVQILYILESGTEPTHD